jgi:hypothetical protein
MKTQRAAVVAVALCASLGVAVPSYAGITARIPVSSQQVDSGQWAAVPSATTLSFGTQGVQQMYFTVTNTGTLPLTGATYTLSGANFKVGMTLSLLACVGGSWNMTSGACVGGVVQTVVTTSGPAASAAVTAPAAVGAGTTLQAQQSKAPAKTTTGKVTVTVDRSQVRAAAVDNA